VLAVCPETAQAREALAATVVTDEEGFALLRPEWDELVDRLELPSPFQTWAWNHVWWKHFGHRGRPHIVVFRAGGSVAGIAPLQERRHVWVSSIVPIGWGNLLTEQLELLLPESHRRQMLAALSAHLAGSDRGWIGLSGLQEGELEGCLGRLGVVSRVDMPFEYRDLPPTWAELVQGLNRSMRGNVKYYPRLMNRDGLAFCVRFAETPAEVSNALADLYRLHAARAGVHDGVVHKDYLERGDHRAFLNEVAPLLAATGQAKVALLEVKGAVVAAQMWLERRGTAFLYYSGYDPDWARYSVAMITTSEILKYAISRGFTRVEFLRGTGHFKTRWDTRRRHRSEVTWARRANSMRLLLDSYRGARQVFRRARRAL
jgi:CelD/BcsL family acetyltransferase involved in cellulose biosynthesis